MCTCLCMYEFFLITTSVKIRLVQIWPIVKYLGSFLRSYTLKIPFPGKHEQKKNNDAPNMAEHTRCPGYSTKLYLHHTAVSKLLCTHNTYRPLCWYLTRVGGRGGSSKANEGRQGGGLRFAYICACIYTLSRRGGRSYRWRKPGPVGGWTE